MLIGYWDSYMMMFIVDGERLSFSVEDLHFMNGLFHRREVVILRQGIQIEGALIFQDYIDIYYEELTEKVTSQILVACIK